jgi:hypothetical protein
LAICFTWSICCLTKPPLVVFAGAVRRSIGAPSVASPLDSGSTAAIGKHKLVEVNHGDMKGSEVAVQPRVDSARPVCSKFNYSPAKLRARWNGYPIVFIDGIQQPSLDRYADFHRAMSINLYREGRPRRNRLLAALRLQGQRSKEAQ